MPVDHANNYTLNHTLADVSDGSYVTELPQQTDVTGPAVLVVASQGTNAAQGLSQSSYLDLLAPLAADTLDTLLCEQQQEAVFETEERQTAAAVQSFSAAADGGDRTSETAENAVSEQVHGDTHDCNGNDCGTE